MSQSFGEYISARFLADRGQEGISSWLSESCPSGAPLRSGHPRPPNLERVWQYQTPDLCDQQTGAWTGIITILPGSTSLLLRRTSTAHSPHTIDR